MDPQMKRIKEKFLDPDEPYRMDRPLLGHAYIVNNLATEMPETAGDAEELRKVYEEMGFSVHVESDCDLYRMKRIRSEIMSEELHRDSNCFMLTVLTHGDQFGRLAAAKENRKCQLAWQIDEIGGLRFPEMEENQPIVEALNKVNTLVGKPKLLLIDACRGTQVTTGQTVPTRSLQPEPELDVVADKADFYVAYATVPGYASAGSYYAQSVAKNLRRYYMTHSIDRIFTCVRHDMETIKLNVAGVDEKHVRISPENRTSLRRVLMFSEFHKNKPRGGQEVEYLKSELERQKLESEKQQIEMMEQMKEMMQTMQRMQTGGQPRDAPAMSQSTDQPDGRNQSGVTPGATKDEIDCRQPERNSKELTDQHVLTVAQAMPDEMAYNSLAVELNQSNIQKNLTNNPGQITNAAYKMLNEWKRTLLTRREQWEVLYKALGDAGLTELQAKLMK